MTASQINHYDYIFYAGQAFKKSYFFKQFSDCNVKSVTHLTSENVGEGNDRYNHKLKGAAQTSMGMIEVFNYSDLN
jgi:hypothetical protein